VFITSQRAKMANQGVHGATGAKDAQHGHRSCRNFGAAGVRNKMGVAGWWDRRMKFPKRIEVVDCEDDFS